MQRTVRAKLGAKALKCLKKGKPVEDQVVADILLEEIRYDKVNIIKIHSSITH